MIIPAPRNFRGGGSFDKHLQISNAYSNFIKRRISPRPFSAIDSSVPSFSLSLGRYGYLIFIHSTPLTYEFWVTWNAKDEVS